jgi:hypothetical protein
VFCLSVLYLIVLFSVFPLEATTSREEHKAKYLGLFPDYISWPLVIAEGESFNLCLLGKDTFKGFLQSIYRKKLIKTKPVKIHYLDNLEQMPNCHLLFISISERKSIPEILDFLKDKPILTISETRGFAEKKGIIQFYMKAQKVSFKINNQAAIRHGLKINSKLLAIAKVIE